MKDNQLIIKCIDTLKRLKEDKILDESINKSIDSSINKVESIMADNKIKVAILGEFSSGKSTFINALLRSKLLSYADEPTTAINTYITYGDKEKTTIYYSNGSKKVVNPSELEKYTKEGRAGKDIDKVHIEYKNFYLKKGITIIDTPGANIDNEMHNIQRGKAIAECSMGIFLISVKSLTSKSFIDFLKKNKNDLGKFIFVISKCDMLEEDVIDIDANNHKRDKLEDVLKYVKNSIKEYGRIDNPRVYTISAYNFLNNISCKVLNVKKSFYNLENDIKKIHEQDREMLILLEMLKVLKQICPNINDILNDKNKLCEYEIKKVNGEIESFERFVYNDYIKFKKDLDDRFRIEKGQLSKRIGQLKESRFNNTISQIKEIYTMATLKNEINGIVINGMENFTSVSSDEIYNNLNKVGHNEFKAVEENFRVYFTSLQKTYKKLGIERNLKMKSLLKNTLIATISYITSSVLLELWFKISGTYMTGIYWDNLPLMVATIMFIIGLMLGKAKVEYHIPYTSKNENLRIRSNNISKDVSSEITEGHGLGAGAIIGALAGGPLGALIGAGIGTVLGTLFLSGRVESLKNNYIEALKEEMDSAEVRLNILVDDTIRRKRSSLINEYQNYVGDNMGLYKELLDGIYNYNNNKFMRLSKSKNTLRNYLTSFESINKEIDTMIKNIK